jgi:uncharacterized OB-fold protein
MTQESPIQDSSDFGFNRCSHCGQTTVPMVEGCPWCGHVEGES